MMVSEHDARLIRHIEALNAADVRFSFWAGCVAGSVTTAWLAALSWGGLAIARRVLFG